MSQYRIPDQNLPGLQASIARLAARAKRIGCPAPTIRVISHEDRADEDLRIQRTWTVEVEGETPRFGGWSFLAVLRHLDIEGARATILSRVPGSGDGDLPAQYRDAAPWCDHCRTARRRNDTFVCRHEDGRLVQVGRQCLADFLGHQDPHALAACAELLAEAGDLCEVAADSDGDFMGSAGSKLWDPLGFLGFVAGSIRRDGWIPRSKADSMMRCPTVTAAQMWAGDLRRGATKDRPTDEDHATAERALAWARNGAFDGRPMSDYEWNLQTCARATAWTDKMLGLAASLLPYYERRMGIERERQHAAQESRHVGTVGKREVFRVRVMRHQVLPGNFGATVLHHLVTPEGARMVWFSSGNTLEGDGWHEVRATVKQHSVRDGVAQTIITRVAPVASAVK